MSESKSTRLRYIRAASLEEMEMAVNSLPFKVETKQILKDNKSWLIFFVLPDSIEWKSVDLT